MKLDSNMMSLLQIVGWGLGFWIKQTMRWNDGWVIWHNDDECGCALQSLEY